MDVVFIHHLIPPYPRMLVATPGKIQFVKNALLTGYLMPSMFVFQFMTYARLTKVQLVLAAIRDMMLLMDYVFILNPTLLHQLMEAAKHGMLIT